jgi:thymidylate kinase
MIIKIHGTSGSGKTTIVRALLELSDPVPADCINTDSGRIEAHLLHLPGVMKPVVVLGPYGKSWCGGLDAVAGTLNHARMLDRYANLGHVLYEGLLGSECYGAMGKASERFGKSHVFAFLDTPIEVCIERVKQRRFDAGNTKPLNEENTRGRIPKIERLYRKLKYELGREVAYIDYKRPVDQILDMLRLADEAEAT